MLLMPDDARNWISRLSDTCRQAYTAEQLAFGLELLPNGIPVRARLAMRIVALRSRLLQTRAQAVVLVETERPESPITKLADCEMPAPEPEAAAEIPALRSNKPKKANFSAVSLDDAAGLLSAFGSSADATDPSDPSKQA